MAWAQETFDLGETRIARRIGSKLEGHSSNNKEKIVAQLCDGLELMAQELDQEANPKIVNSFKKNVRQKKS